MTDTVQRGPEAAPDAELDALDEELRRTSMRDDAKWLRNLLLRAANAIDRLRAEVASAHGDACDKEWAWGEAVAALTAATERADLHADERDAFRDSLNDATTELSAETKRADEATARAERAEAARQKSHNASEHTIVCDHCGWACYLDDNEHPEGCPVCAAESAASERIAVLEARLREQTGQCIGEPAEFATPDAKPGQGAGGGEDG